MSNIYEYPGDSAILDNGNLLVNPDFRINQRNIKDITITTYPLRDIADVWKIDNAPMGKCRAVQNHDSTISFVNFGDEDGAGITQLIQRGVVQEGETYCASVNIIAHIGNVKFRVVQASYPYSEVLSKEITEDGISQVSASIPNTGYEGRYNFNIQCDAQSSFKIAWCKLELGDNATSFTHPDYDTEILKIGEMRLTYSNPNLLYNPDFKINQRGAKSYTSSGYTVDRWALVGGMSAHVIENGIKLTSSTKRSYFCQAIDPKELLGKKIVLSCSVKVESGYWFAQIRTTEKRYNICRIGNKSGVFKLIADVPLDTTQIQVRFVNATNDSSEIDIKWAKLEIGGARSLFVPPDKSEELRKCCKYYAKYYGDTDVHLMGCVFKRSYGESYNSLINVPIELPTTMNRNPSFKMSSQDNGVCLNIAGQIDEQEDTKYEDIEITDIKCNSGNKHMLLTINANLNSFYDRPDYTDGTFESMPIYLTIKPGSYIAFDAEMELEV